MNMTERHETSEWQLPSSWAHFVWPLVPLHVQLLTQALLSLSLFLSHWCPFKCPATEGGGKKRGEKRQWTEQIFIIHAEPMYGRQSCFLPLEPLSFSPFLSLSLFLAPSLPILWLIPLHRVQLLLLFLLTKGHKKQPEGEEWLKMDVASLGSGTCSWSPTHMSQPCDEWATLLSFHSCSISLDDSDSGHFVSLYLWFWPDKLPKHTHTLA